LQDLFGEGVPLPAALDALVVQRDSEAGSASEAVINTPSTITQFADAAYAVADWVFADDGRRGSLGLCKPTTAGDPCVRQSLAKTGEPIFRRPLSEAELDSLVSLAHTLDTELGDPDKSFRYAFASLLQSPHFLYRVELGEPDPDDLTRLRYTDWEMASRLALSLWQSAPDKELLAAARAGKLHTEDQIRAQAERMLGDERSARFIEYFLKDYFHYADLDHLTKSSPAWTPALRDAMREEFRLLARSILDTDRDYRELFTSTTTFVNRELAELYGIPFPEAEDPASFVSVSLPPNRSGILTTGSLLARYSGESVAPIHRGRFVRMTLLCKELQAPENLAELIQEQESKPQLDPTITKSRYRALERLASPTCASCHQSMDPIGLGFDQFGAIGALQSEVDGAKTSSAGWLDASPKPSRAFGGPVELAGLLVEEAALTECTVSNIYQRMVGRFVNGDEQWFMERLASGFVKSGYRFRRLLVDIVSSESFRYASASKQPP
jgi:hypothetical protein